MYIPFILACLISLTPDNKISDNFHLASKATAIKLLNSEDEFTSSWSQFDIDSRLKKNNGTKEELFELISSEVLEWTTEEEKRINSVLSEIDELIEAQSFKFDIPDEIFLLKTTGDEEGGASGYTRGNYIILKSDVLSGDKESLKHLLVHELFHVLTRSNSEFRTQMYDIIGFKVMNKIDYPDSIKSKRITNPDAPQTDSYISLKVDNKIVDCMMVLYSDRDYNGGEFFSYLKIGFLKLTGGDLKEVEYVDDEITIYTFNDVSDFFEQVGRNTQYIIHPEEIMAENFSHAILNSDNLESPHIVDAIKQLISKKN